MTPAINMAKKHKIIHTIHQYQHDPASEAYGLEAAEKLNIDNNRVFKTLVVSIDTRTLAVAIIPVANKLSLKAMAKALNVKKVAMALPGDVERSTGYVLGGVSPLGQKKLLATVIDDSGAEFDTIFVSAGKRGMEIELSFNDLKNLTKAKSEHIKC
ncbi:Cys-tRNA(Pro) deacylase [Gammaproteobacteria bacterium AS21]|jgi:Cys-tRNA(Pro)/Cys-tRNA(Cys) deacylase